MSSASTQLGHISPFFIVTDLARTVAYYEKALGFDVRVSSPSDSPFFAIVGRDSVQVHLKEVSDEVSPRPNSRQHPWARWDAFIYLADPDALARELSTRGVEFHRQLMDTDDGLRGFEVADPDGYVLFFGRPL